MWIKVGASQDAQVQPSHLVGLVTRDSLPFTAVVWCWAWWCTCGQQHKPCAAYLSMCTCNTTQGTQSLVQLHIVSVILLWQPLVYGTDRSP